MCDSKEAWREYGRTEEAEEYRGADQVVRDVFPTHRHESVIKMYNVNFDYNRSDLLRLN